MIRTKKIYFIIGVGVLIAVVLVYLYHSSINKVDKSYSDRYSLTNETTITYNSEKRVYCFKKEENIKEEIFIFNDHYLIISSTEDHKVIFKVYESELMILENGCWKVYKKGFSEIDPYNIMYDLEKLNLSSYKCLSHYPYNPNLTTDIC